MTSQAFQLSADDSHGLHATGRITFVNAASALRAMPAVRGSLAMDLAGLDDADSAALAVLVAWAAKAQAQDVAIRYLNAPVPLRNLAHLCDLDGLFAENAAPR
ncbi:MAG: STAS domain-containing protein [Rudaea sp.]